jgi:hypothetical protein
MSTVEQATLPKRSASRTARRRIISHRRHRRALEGSSRGRKLRLLGLAIQLDYDRHWGASGLSALGVRVSLGALCWGLFPLFVVSCVEGYEWVQNGSLFGFGLS